MIERFSKFNVPFHKKTNEQSGPSEIAVRDQVVSI